MHHIMFDIDGTLVESYELDSQCFIEAVKEVTGLSIDADWARYRHVTDAGILDEVLSSGDTTEIDVIKADVKQRFLDKLKLALEHQPVPEILGAAEFLHLLQSMNNVVLSLATGGWRESAKLKLASAGICCSSIPLLSSDDHYSRVEIMRLATEQVSGDQYPCTYFGDGLWDRDACEQLGYRFILVGNRFSYQPAIGNFKSPHTVLACLGL